MIEIKDVDTEVDESNIEDVNVGIHKEYDMLVFRYANLLKQYINLDKDYLEIKDKYEETVKELAELKEMHKKRSVRFCGYLGEEDDLK